MTDDKIYPIEASADQGQGSYQGVDNWKTTTLEPGTKIVQLDHPFHPATETASQYFTTYEELQKHINPETGKVDTAALSERLQVSAFRGDDASQPFLHSPSVRIYEVVEPITVATAKITDNPTFGQGGADQFFATENTDELIKHANNDSGMLKYFGDVESSNRIPRLPIYDELKGVPRDDIPYIVEKYHDEYIDALEQINTPETNQVADDMVDRQAFSETAREIKGDPEAVKAVEIPDAKATILDLDAQTLSQVEAMRDAALGHTPSGALNEADSRHVDDVLSDPKVKGFSVDPDMETQHYYSKTQNAVVTIDKDGAISLERGTVHRPAGHIFRDHLQDAAERFPDFHEGRLPARITGGVSGVAEAVAGMNKTGVWKTLGNVAEDSGKFLGKASKILGPVGVMAATAEAATLEAKAREFEEYGALSEEAVTQYDLILVGHVGQATVDPTMVGGEALTKTAFETWANHHGISDEMKAELAPGLLIDMVGKAGQAIYDNYKDIKGYGENLLRETAEGLEDLVGMPSHHDMIDEMDPHSAPSNGFKDFLGLPKFSPSFGRGSWREGALQMDGQDQTMREASIQHASFSKAAISESSGTVSLEDAIVMLAEDEQTLSLSAQDGHSSPIQEALNHPDAAHMFKTLHINGVTTLKADITPNMGAEDRASELLLAGRDATLEAGLPLPSEARELEATQEHNNSYEDDYSPSV